MKKELSNFWIVIGENDKVMILSTPEGTDNPAKYLLMFREAAVMIINKMDLMPYVDFNLEKARKDALTINPKLKIFELSCKTSGGLTGWIEWLSAQITTYKKS